MPTGFECCGVFRDSEVGALQVGEEAVRGPVRPSQRGPPGVWVDSGASSGGTFRSSASSALATAVESLPPASAASPLPLLQGLASQDDLMFSSF